MAFEDTFSTRVKSLIKDPQRGVKKIIPFIKSRTDPYYRSLLEMFRIYVNSKPFSNHDKLLEFVNFENGFFVQCGGSDGYSNDPTYYLEKVLGWKGIIVEPLPIYEFCKKNRPKSVVYNYAVGSFEDGKKETVSFIDCYAMSCIEGSFDDQEEYVKAGEAAQNIKAKRITVPIKPIQFLIDDYMQKNGEIKIDLFVVDTEGYEFPVIQGLDFNKNKPTYLLLEIRKMLRWK